MAWKEALRNLTGDLLVYGDLHGEWQLLLEACYQAPPAAPIILGDCELTFSLSQQLAPIFDAGIRVRWISGTHDVDDEGGTIGCSATTPKDR